MTIDDWMMLFVLAAGYFLPTILAVLSKSDGWVLILLVNLLFGWTVIGWFGCIFIAAIVPDKKQAAYRNQVRRARDEFYLREQEKFQTTK